MQSIGHTTNIHMNDATRGNADGNLLIRQLRSAANRVDFAHLSLAQTSVAIVIF